MNEKDNRIKLMNEILSGIKVCKGLLHTGLPSP